MDNARSGITWIDEDKWIGSCLTFTDPQPSRWRIDQNLAGNEYPATETEVKECMMPSEARGIFVCSNVDDPAQKAVVKTRMQYVPCLIVILTFRVHLGYRNPIRPSSLAKSGRNRQIRT
jgi:hypothetical protein